MSGAGNGTRGGSPMSDDRWTGENDDVDDLDDEDVTEERRPPPGGEGVRIIGAQEARAAYEGDEPRRPQGQRFPMPEEAPGAEGAESEPRPEEPPPARPPVGGQIFGERPGPGPEEDKPTGSVELPHWTEPPSGEIQAVGAEEEPTGGQARYRDADHDWDQPDMSDLAGDDRGGVPDQAPIGVDDDEAFAREVEARRRQVRQARQAGAPPPPPGAAERFSSGVRRMSAEGPEAPPPPGAVPGAPAAPSAPGRSEPPARPQGGMLEPGMQPPPEVAPSPGERDLPTAILVGVAIGVAALVTFNLGRGPTTWLVAIIATLASAELYAALRARGYRPAAPVGLAATTGLVLASYDRGFEGFVIILGLAVITSFLWFLIQAEDARPVINVAMTLFPIGYIGVLAAFGGLLLALPNGIGILLGVVIAGVAYDVFGYFVGSRIGTRRIAPSISPNKTSEGLLAGIVAAVLAALILVRPIHPWDAGSALWLGVIVGVAAPIGDLIESMLKRDMGLKDFGTLIPGHGGVLDRFDALLFSLAPTFFLVRVLEVF